MLLLGKCQIGLRDKQIYLNAVKKGSIKYVMFLNWS